MARSSTRADPARRRRSVFPPWDGMTALKEVAEVARSAFRYGLTASTAAEVCQVLHRNLGLFSVSIVTRRQVLAFVGPGADHHQPGSEIQTSLTKRVFRTGETLLAASRAEIGCPVPGCPLESAMVAPLKVHGVTVGALKVYQGAGEVFRPGVPEAVTFLADLIATQLERAELQSEVERLSRVELRAMRAEISPHFVFNVLNSVAALIGANPERARDLVLDFADFLRNTLQQHGEFCSLAEELWYVEKYLAFERLRLGDRLRVVVDVTPDVQDTILPVLTVEPLVENAVTHGIEPRPGGGTVCVRARADGDDVVMSVSDDGVGIPEPRLALVLDRGSGSRLGIGLANVHERLRALYWREQGLVIDSAEGRGTTVSFRVPRHGGSGG